MSDDKRVARQLVKEISRFSRDCERDQETDTERAWQLLDAARRLLVRLGRD